MPEEAVGLPRVSESSQICHEGAIRIGYALKYLQYSKINRENASVPSGIQCKGTKKL